VGEWAHKLLIKTTRALASNAMHGAWSAFGFGIASYRQPMRAGRMRVICDLKRQREMLLTPLEANQLFSVVQATTKVGGCMAEIGVYRGASARLIREADPTRPLHLFDTFEGLPQPADTDTAFNVGQFVKGQFSCSLDDVRLYLGVSDNVHFHPGLFPSTTEPVRDQRFSFVHSDVDLYASTRSVLEFFYPRLLPGGIFLSHDFVTCRGPHDAIAEFFNERPEPVIELSGDQAMIVKL
jgi:hypothetical protein